MLTRSLTHTHTQTQNHTYTRTQKTQRNSHVHACTNTNPLAHIGRISLSHSVRVRHTRVSARARTHTQSHTLTSLLLKHVHTIPHTHAHNYTHTYTHIQMQSQEKFKKKKTLKSLVCKTVDPPDVSEMSGIERSAVMEGCLSLDFAMDEQSKTNDSQKVIRDYQVQCALSSLQGHDTMVIAPVGIGKSICISLSMLVQLKFDKNAKGIVLCPTKTLQSQQFRDFKAQKFNVASYDPEDANADDVRVCFCFLFFCFQIIRTSLVVPCRFLYLKGSTL
jgi:hypothetical protein